MRDAGIAILAVLLLVWTTTLRRPESPPRETPEVLAPDPASVFPPARTARPPAPPATSRAAAVSPEEDIARLGRQHPSANPGSRHVFFESDDLARLVLDLLPQALRGDGASQHLIYLSLETCRPYLLLDAASAQAVLERTLSGFGDPTPEESAYWRREYQRCRGFATSDWSAAGDALGEEKPGSELEYASVWFERAARTGHPAAVADWVLRPGPFSARERADMLRDALAAGGADVYWLLSVHSGDLNEGTANVPALAWLLVACRAGFDCTERARWFRIYNCISADRRCPPGLSAVEHYWYSVREYEREQAYRLAGRITEMLRAGDLEKLPLPPLNFIGSAEHPEEQAE